MSGSAAASPPAVDEGDAPNAVGAVLSLMAPSWSRLHATVLVLIPMLLVLAIWETFRIPQPAIATFILLMIARGDALSTIGSSFATAVSVALGALLAIAVLAFSLSQPAVRVPVMALMVFATMMAVRGTTLGPIAFLIGFFAIDGTTLADELSGLAGTPADITDTEGTGLPEGAYMPPEEALLHALLWLGVVAAIPALLLAATARAIGPDPRTLLRRRIADRADAAAAFCDDAPGASERLRGVAREGVAPLLDLVGVAERAGGTEALHAAHLRMIRALNRLLLLLVAWDMARPAGSDDARFLRPVGAFAAALGARLRPGSDATALPPPPPDGAEDGLDGALFLLAGALRDLLARLRAAEAERDRALDPGAPRPRAARKPLLQPNAFGGANIRFALKVTLAVMVAYLIESGLEWQAISTCIVTCLFVSLGTIGETVHKMTLRVVGCLIGATLGIGAILLLMPSMTGFAQLAVLFFPVAFLSAWIGFGSPRIAYAGWQILLAFSLTVLQGYGPTLDMQTARDRVVGIMIGNLVTSLVFRFVWPVTVADAVRRDMAAALETLGALIALDGADPDAEGALRDGFVAALARVGAVIPNDRFEMLAHPDRGAAAMAGAGRIGRATLARLSRLVVPVSVIATDEAGPARDAIPTALRDEARAFHRAMADWFDRAAAWMRTGAGQDRLRATLPPPPEAGGLSDTLAPVLARRIRGRAALYALLSRQIGDFLDAALPPEPATLAPDRVTGRPALAAG